jgi:hypothetical protein
MSSWWLIVLRANADESDKYKRSINKSCTADFTG